MRQTKSRRDVASRNDRIALAAVLVLLATFLGSTVLL